jgi:hypothetical protein
MPRLLQFQPGGINTVSHPDFGVVETYSSTCSHCQKITDFPSRRQMMDYVDICRVCMKLICLDCYGKPCRPYEQEVERQEHARRLRDRIHMQGWKCY